MNEIVKLNERQMRDLLKQDEVIGQFESILGKQSARHYVGSVAIAYANSPDLQECHPDSIVRSALRCAAMELSCDPVAKQGQLVPYYNTKRGRKEAQLIVHYKGLILLAQRSGLYRYINVSEIYEGYTVEQDILTGIHSVKVDPDKFNARKIIGYLGYLETKAGFKKSVYWTVERIKEHAGKFAPKNPLYNDPKHAETMRIKTVFRDLLSWADLGGLNTTQAQALETALDEPEEVINDEVIEAATNEPAPDENDLRYNDCMAVTTPKGTALSSLNDEQIHAVATSQIPAYKQAAEAAQFIINYRQRRDTREVEIIDELFPE